MQKERDKVMRAFRNGTAHILVATDIAARGLDVSDLSFVIHYTLPDQDEYYTHRSGRTARAGKSGISLCLVSTTEIKLLRVYEQKFGCKFKEIK
jgi:ATP-dependent RNA helicase DeaD